MDLAEGVATAFGALPDHVRSNFRTGEGFRTGVRLAFHERLAWELSDYVSLVDGRLRLFTEASRAVNGVVIPVLGRHALWYRDVRDYAGMFWNPLLGPSRPPETIVPWDVPKDVIGVGVGAYFEQLKQMVCDIDSFLRMVLPERDARLVNAPFGPNGPLMLVRASEIARA